MKNETDLRLEARYAASKMVLGPRRRRPQGKKPNAWTEADDALLRELYPLHGPGAAPHFPGRTRKALCERAGRLKLRVSTNWTPEQDAIIREHYVERGGAYVAALLGKVERAVWSHARLLGLQANRKRPLKVMEPKPPKPPKAPKVAKPAAPAPTLVKRREKARPAPLAGEPIITSETRVTICPPFVDRRWTAGPVPRVVAADECRDWAREVAA
jgi:hypothetical protein